MTKRSKAFNFDQLKLVASLIAQGKVDSAVRYLRRVTGTDGRKTFPKNTFGYYLQKFARFVRTGNPEFSIFVKGNGKLPFLAFSSLPGKGFCPGAGECLDYCYTFKGWRMPAVFFRQAQNHILLQTEEGRAHIVEALKEINPNHIRKQALADVRLYVDGDFCSTEVLAFWMDAIRPYTETRFYGYSKSIPQFIEYVEQGGVIPPNYTLNLSSGGIYENLYPQVKTVQKADGKPLVRGEFKAYSLGKQFYMKHFNAEAKRKLRKAAQADPINLTEGKAKIFICPGKCGDCVSRKDDNGERVPFHACGDQNFFQGTRIIIPIH